AAIEARLDAVEELLARPEWRGRLRDRLRPIQDLERLLARVALGTATVREVAGIRETLRRLPALRNAVAEGRAALIADCRDGIDTLEDLRARLDAALVEDPPPALKDGDVVRPGYDAALDELRALRASGRDYLARLETRERQRTGIPSLKVRYNRVFGYYLEVSRPNLHLVPAEYSRKQTMTNAERFTLPELKEYEEKVLTAEERIAALEAEIFGSLRQEIAARSERLLRTADALAVLDVLAALAETAERHRYGRPRIREDRRLRIAGGRHPVLETTCEPAGFQANDTEIDPETAQILILTGPNMGGKSTYLRQVALITLLAQAGSFVPADAAEVGVVDRIFSRIGASDNLRLGQSTFLSEMLEVANILNNATDRSLILLDEVGRGTSTFDGLSLAWAVVEHLHEEAGVAAKTLFATHYHELTALAESLTRVRNLTMAVREGQDGILFLHRVVAGSSDRSYGIHVARLAGVPGTVIHRAEVVLRRLESQALRAGGRGRRSGAGAPPGPAQLPLDLEADPERPLRRALRAIEPERITPLEAIRVLADLREKAED
ncbi:MAG: DNA mismatch repair protein MutS, partial [Acidobacteria bacterium]|nr:DNA mismatch repair protein MutS [Acidobacteriota bacterium]